MCENGSTSRAVAQNLAILWITFSCWDQVVLNYQSGWLSSIWGQTMTANHSALCMSVAKIHVVWCKRSFEPSIYSHQTWLSVQMLARLHFVQHFWVTKALKLSCLAFFRTTSTCQWGAPEFRSESYFRTNSQLFIMFYRKEKIPIKYIWHKVLSLTDFIRPEFPITGESELRKKWEKGSGPVPLQSHYIRYLPSLDLSWPKTQS